jgi:signal transduction histidine kinase
VQGVLREALRAIPAMIECSEVLVYLRASDTGDFQLAATETSGAETKLPTVVSADVAEGFLLSMDRPFVLSKEVVTALPQDLRRGSNREALIAPLRWEPEGFGAIAINASSDDSRFSERDLDLATGIADIASLALGNASRFHELEESAARLRTLDEMKNMFLDAVSHELRTPLAAVLGIALTLGREDVPLSDAETRDLLDRLTANAKKLDRLLSDLLDLDRLARGIVEPKRRPTDLGELVQAVVESSELLVAARSTPRSHRWWWPSTRRRSNASSRTCSRTRPATHQRGEASAACEPRSRGCADRRGGRGCRRA